MERRALYLELHPYDVLDLGATLDPALRVPGEQIESVVIEATAEATALGVQVEPRPSQTDPTYGVVGYAVVSVAPAQRDATVWAGYGRVVPIRVQISTSLDRVHVREVQMLISRRAGHPTAARVVVLGDNS